MGTTHQMRAAKALAMGGSLAKAPTLCRPSGTFFNVYLVMVYAQHDFECEFSQAGLVVRNASLVARDELGSHVERV